MALVAGCGASGQAGAVAAPVQRSVGAAQVLDEATAAPAAVRTSLPVRVGRPCVTAPTPRHWDHVVWIVMENKRPSQVIGSRAAPFATSLARQCAHAASYTAVSHPSLPNYLALTSGSTHGVHDDAGPSTHPIAGPSIFSVAAAGRRSWATFVESMPARCSHSSSGVYAVKHNPATYYTALARTCVGHDAPMGTPSRGYLATALARGTLPAFSLLIPNMCDDSHDCSVATGDAWLRTWMNTIVASPTYRAGRTAVFITWDEDDGSVPNQVTLLAVAPSIHPASIARGGFGHLALLHTTLLMLNLADHLTHAQPSMRKAFRL